MHAYLSFFYDGDMIYGNAGSKANLESDGNNIKDCMLAIDLVMYVLGCLQPHVFQ